MRNLLLVVVFLGLGVSAFAQNVGTLQGKVTDSETGEPLVFCAVVLFKNGVQTTGVETDLDGNYSISNLDPGDYDVEVAYVGYQTQLVQKVRVFAGKVVPLNVKLTQGIVIDGVEIVAYKVPLIEQDNTTQGKTITSEEIRALPLKNINAIASSTAGISTLDGEDVAMRGSRTDATNYYVDGIRVRGALVPQFEIEQMQVITGGLEALYGDVSGGVISLTTKGPANTFSGGAELETSKFLDAYGYSEANLNLSGPIIKRNNQSILGFRVSGRYVHQDEDNPPATGVYAASEELINRLSANPVLLAGNAPYSATEALRASDVELLKARPNENRGQMDFTGRLDLRVSDAIDVSLSGSYRNFSNRFTPNGWGVFNWTRNPYQKGQSFRSNLRFRHRLGVGRSGGSDDSGARRASVIQNASYTIQVGFERDYRSEEDVIHGSNLFRYGHVGQFDFEWVPVFDTGQHSGFRRDLVRPYSRELYDYNPVLANYNNVLSAEQLLFFENYTNINGLRQVSVYNQSWGFHTNPGAVYNRYGRGEDNVFTLNVNASFDFLPGGSEKGRHSIQFGILHEQRVDRDYVVAPFALLNIARLSANLNINGLGVDLNNPVDTLDDGTIVYGKQLIEPAGDVKFYRAVRERFNAPLSEFFNVDGVNPDNLSLDLFSPRELTDQQLISFSGYDYLGNKLSSSVEFNDFFTARDRTTGERLFLVAPNKPIYQAFFLQDKFTFKDIIFRLGLRVDRFDANTKVMRDPFSLYNIMSAKDFYDAGLGGQRPSGVQDDWKVYVDGEGSNSVRAFRDGEQWYTGSGTQVNDGNVIWGGEIVTPRLYENVVNNIKSLDFDPNNSFEDYKPQVNWMPRIAVSFPISDEANFFAHYDILVQRPPSRAFESALGYYYFTEFISSPTNPRNNPALKPERTIDYEVGFQQRLTSASAIKLSAYYKELRDMIQIRQFLYVAPVNQYTSFDNLDFGTVKGFSFQYELRRTRNVQLTANYTLQFADGTGSDATSQSGIGTSQRGNLRTLFPLTRDERHAVKGVFDFRYDSGKRYNGPRWFGKDIFANAGFNFQFNAISGRPYTRRQRALPTGGEGFLGSINGARLPWNFSIDMRAEKTFRLNSPQAAKPINMTLSLRVLNLLDTRNIRGVYSVSGSPDDSGFLASADGAAVLRNHSQVGESLLNAGRTPEAYIDSYSWAVLNPGFYSLPRRIFLGLLFDF